MSPAVPVVPAPVPVGEGKETKEVKVPAVPAETKEVKEVVKKIPDHYFRLHFRAGNTYYGIFKDLSPDQSVQDREARAELCNHLEKWMEEGDGCGRGAVFYDDEKCIRVRTAYPIVCFAPEDYLRVNVMDGYKCIDYVLVKPPLDNPGVAGWTSTVYAESTTLKQKCKFLFAQPGGTGNRDDVLDRTVLWMFHYGF